MFRADPVAEQPSANAALSASGRRWDPQAVLAEITRSSLSTFNSIFLHPFLNVHRGLQGPNY